MVYPAALPLHRLPGDRQLYDRFLFRTHWPKYEVKALGPIYLEMKVTYLGKSILMSDTSDFNWLSREIMPYF
jgi:hypothetical protein